jgi:hypothetical protein
MSHHCIRTFTIDKDDVTRENRDQFAYIYDQSQPVIGSLRSVLNAGVEVILCKFCRLCAVVQCSVSGVVLIRRLAGTCYFILKLLH